MDYLPAIVLIALGVGGLLLGKIIHRCTHKSAEDSSTKTVKQAIEDMKEVLDKEEAKTKSVEQISPPVFELAALIKTDKYALISMDTNYPGFNQWVMRAGDSILTIEGSGSNIFRVKIRGVNDPIVKTEETFRVNGAESKLIVGAIAYLRQLNNHRTEKTGRDAVGEAVNKLLNQGE